MNGILPGLFPSKVGLTESGALFFEMAGYFLGVPRVHLCQSFHSVMMYLGWRADNGNRGYEFIHIFASALKAYEAIIFFSHPGEDLKLIFAGLAVVLVDRHISPPGCLDAFFVQRGRSILNVHLLIPRLGAPWLKNRFETFGETCRRAQVESQFINQAFSLTGGCILFPTAKTDPCIPDRKRDFSWDFSITHAFANPIKDFFGIDL